MPLAPRHVALTIVSCATLSLAGARHAHAQLSRFSATDDQRAVRFGAAGGVVIPRTGASARDLEAGLHGQAFALVRLPGLPALRLNVDYARMKFARPTTTTGAAAADLDASRTLLDGVAAMHVDLLHGPVRPYVLAGVGAFNIRDAVAQAAAGNATALDRAGTSTNFGVDGGAGVAFRLGRLDGFVETHLQNVYTHERGLVDTKSIQSFPISFGLTF